MRTISILTALALTTTSALGGASLDGIISSELRSKVHEIQSSCGSRIVSGRDARGNRSNHPIGRAVDLVGNPGCIYSHLKGWRGGYSTDYSRVHHTHISYNPGGQEWGLRFVHGGGGHRHRYAHRHGHSSRAFASASRERFIVVGSVDRHIPR
jgi:hypothetical protein